MADTLSEFQAAQQYRLSPRLLRWLTTYAPKSDGRKLPFTEDSGIYYFDKKELADFDAYMQLPWPKPTNGQRPHLPVGIKEEIKFEAEGRCPACHTTLGEYAHIEPVATTLNNHPHNLIYLCPNHHTAYDYGYRYANIELEEVLMLKKSLQLFQTIKWGLQGKIFDSYLTLIKKLEVLFELEKQDISALESNDFQKLLDLAVIKLRKAGTSSAQPAVKAIVSAVQVAEDAPARQQVQAFMTVQPQVIAAMLDDPDLKACPLCYTRGYTDEYETCPVCEGEGYVDKGLVVDLQPYQVIDCQLCQGVGHTKDFETCPPCGGEGKLTREQAELINFSQFELVECRLCSGHGSTPHFDTCPPCGGSGFIPVRDADHMDWLQYELVECPVCEGHGYTSFYDDCPVCMGELKIARHQLSKIGVADYQPVGCPFCDGHGHTKKDEHCAACDGGGKLTPHLIRKQKGY